MLGEANSRFKDFYDIWLLSEHRDFDGSVLQQAIQKTFERRQTDYPTSLPSGLTIEFASRSQKDWERTVKDKNKLPGGKESDFVFVVKRITDFLLPPLVSWPMVNPSNNIGMPGEIGSSFADDKKSRERYCMMRFLEDK